MSKMPSNRTAEWQRIFDRHGVPGSIRMEQKPPAPSVDGADRAQPEGAPQQYQGRAGRSNRPIKPT